MADSCSEVSVLRRALFVLLALLPLTAAAADVPPHPDVPEDAFTEGVQGIQLADLTPGTGPGLSDGDTARLRLTVWTAGGSGVFAMAPEDPPLTVVVGQGQLIPGIELALDGLAAGGTRFVKVPSNLAYGDKPEGGAPAGPLHVLIERLEAPAAPKPPALGARTPPESPPEVRTWQSQPNGLKYSDLKVGSGPTPKKGQTVVVEYTGWLAEDGTRFDSSYGRPLPFRFVLGADQVVLGWEKGLRDMRVGGHRMLHVPAYMGYGGGAAGSIPPHSDLLFEVELLAVE